MKIVAICFIFIFNSIYSQPISNDYSNYSLFKIVPQYQLQLDQIKQIERYNTFDVDFWDHPRKILQVVTVMVGPQIKTSFINFLERKHIPFIITKVEPQSYNPIENTKAVILQPFNLNKFNTFNEVMNWLGAIKCRKCQLINLGKTSQGRNISLIKIGTPGRRGVFIDAGIHAREWVASASALHLINILINETDPLGNYLTSKFTFHIVPFANPDGYEYSRTTNRFWRKTLNVNTNSRCLGTDPNRNYPLQFGGAGSSKDACSDVYSGSKSLSIPETILLTNYIKKNIAQLTAYIAVHSYGRLILLPWGCNYSKPADYNELYRVGLAMKAEVTKFANAIYDVIPGSELYPVGGASDDWAKSIGIKYVHTIEMGPNKFDPLAVEIFALSRELIGAVKGMVNAIP